MTPTAPAPTRRKRKKKTTRKASRKKAAASKRSPPPVTKAKRLTGIAKICAEGIPGYNAWTDPGGATFNKGKALDAIAFFEEILTHTEGAIAGDPFILENWQRALIGNLFGWIRRDGSRRYREAFVYVPRKNGKTTLIAGIALYCLTCDDEKGAQIFSAAGDREQASLIFRQAVGMVRNEPELERRLGITPSKKRIIYEESGSYFEAVSSEAGTKHGLNPHVVIIDELHVQPDSELVDALLTGQGNRTQPLAIYITTADFARPSICNLRLEYSEKIRDGIISDSAFLPCIFKAERGDDWKDPKTWAKANPNLGVSVSVDYMQRQSERAENEPSYLNTFLRLHLNITTEQDVRWIPLDKWDDCATPGDPVKARARALESLQGRTCFAGIDLSSTTDVTALSLYFPNENEDGDTGGGGDVLTWYWIPEDNAHQREKRDRVPYLTWARQGFVEMTPGTVIDYRYIRRRVLEIFDTFDLVDVAIDRWNSRQLTQQMQDEDEIPVFEFGQGFASMSEPSKAFEALVMSGKLDHHNDPVLRWMASNVTARTDPAGNIKPDKGKSTEKIDGIVALIMAIGRSMSDTVETSSVYAKQNRGLLTL
jgi:phage terminase large subunit-like protein